MASSNATLLDVLSNTQQPQAYIKTVSDEDASKCPDVQGLYDKWRNADGTLDNVLTIHSCNPTALEAHFQLYKCAVRSETSLNKVERELVAVAVSLENECRYCPVHHTAGLKAALREEGRGRESTVLRGSSINPEVCSPRERAMIDFAVKLTKTPSAVSAQDVALLRSPQVDLDDRQIHDLVNCVAYFAYVNRVVAGLGVIPGGREGKPGQ